MHHHDDLMDGCFEIVQWRVQAAGFARPTGLGLEVGDILFLSSIAIAYQCMNRRGGNTELGVERFRQA